MIMMMSYRPTANANRTHAQTYRLTLVTLITTAMHVKNVYRPLYCSRL